MDNCTDQKSIPAQIGHEQKQVWVYITVFPALGRPKKEDYEFEASLGYRGNFKKNVFKL